MRGITVVTALLLASAPAVAGDDHRCLTEAIYFEARDQGWVGMVAVGVVIQNRVRSERYPNTICAVVRQGRYSGTHPIRNRCQFSYWCDGKPEIPDSESAWQESKDIASLLLSTRVDVEGIENATHYHATWMTPTWASLLSRKQKIGGHIFYVFE